MIDPDPRGPAEGVVVFDSVAAFEHADVVATVSQRTDLTHVHVGSVHFDLSRPVMAAGWRWFLAVAKREVACADLAEQVGHDAGQSAAQTSSRARRCRQGTPETTPARAER